MTTGNTITSHQSKKKRVDDQQLPSDSKSFQVQRRRVWRACEGCRRKKIKCDGNEPVCTQCSSAKTQCTWLQTKDRAALSRHYVQELETRLLQMETLFAQITPILEQIGQPTDGGASSDPSQSFSGRLSPSSASLIQSVLPKVLELKAETSETVPTESQKAHAIDDMSEAVDQLALDEHGHLRWIGGSSTMSLIQAFRTLTTDPVDRVSPMEDDPRSPGPNANKLYFPASVFFGRVRALPDPEDVEYPERDLADKLVDTYFSRFHFLLPILDKPSFLRQYAYLMEHAQESTRAGVETGFIALVFSVFACASRFVDDSRLSTGSDDDGGVGMLYYERALILHYISHASIQVSHVQIFTLMSAFLCSVNCLPQAWLLIGQAVRFAQDLGLHRSPRRLSISSVEKETHRKIWWGVYTMDRMLALALGRPLAIEDADCDVELPVDVEDESLPEYFSGAHMTSKQPSLMAGFIALVLLYKITGKVLRKVYALDTWRDSLDQDRKEDLQHTVEALDKELTQWCDELPIEFKSTPITDQQVSAGAVLCSHYYSVLTTLHRNFLPGKRDQPVVAKSTAKALSSARSCIRLAPSMKNVVPCSLHSTFFLQNLFSSAVIILLYAMHVADVKASSAAMDEVRACLEAIASWEGFWPGARKCKELLLDLTTTANEAIKNSLKRQTGGFSVGGFSSVQSESSRPGSSSSRRRPDKQVKRQPGRPRSRDVRHESVSQHVDVRTRSESRKRPHDDGDEISRSPIRSNPFAPHSSTRRHSGNISNHSSPQSAHSIPSPKGPGEPILETSMEAVDASFVGNSSRSPTLQMNPTLSYDYDFNRLSQNSLSSPWDGPGGGDQGPQGSLFYNPSASSYMLGAYPSNMMNSAFSSYDGSSTAGLGSAMVDLYPPSEDFAASGLPFRGLDFIRNYPADAYVGDQSLWSFDTRAFGQDPEMPFSFPDVS